MPPSDEIENVPPCMSDGASLPVARLGGERRHFLRDVEHALLVGVLITGTTRPLGVSRETDVVVLLQEHGVAGVRSIDALTRDTSSAPRRSLDQERQHRQLRRVLVPLVLPVAGTRKASSSVMSASSWFVTWRITDRVARQRRAGDLADARHRDALHRAELEKSIAATAAGSSRVPAPRRGGRGRRPCALAITAFTCWRTSSGVDAAFRPAAATYCRSTPSSRANLRTDGDACGFAPGAPSSIGSGRAPISVWNAWERSDAAPKPMPGASPAQHGCGSGRGCGRRRCLRDGAGGGAAAAGAGGATTPRRRAPAAVRLRHLVAQLIFNSFTTPAARTESP